MLRHAVIAMMWGTLSWLTAMQTGCVTHCEVEIYTFDAQTKKPLYGTNVHFHNNPVFLRFNAGNIDLSQYGATAIDGLAKFTARENSHPHVFLFHPGYEDVSEYIHVKQFGNKPYIFYMNPIAPTKKDDKYSATQNQTRTFSESQVPSSANDD